MKTTTANAVKTGDIIQHPAKQWPPRRVIEVQPRGGQIRFVIESVKSGETTGVTFPASGAVLVA